MTLALLLSLATVATVVVSCGTAVRSASSQNRSRRAPLFEKSEGGAADSLRKTDGSGERGDGSGDAGEREARRAGGRTGTTAGLTDTLEARGRSGVPDSLSDPIESSVEGELPAADTLSGAGDLPRADTLPALDTVAKAREPKKFLDAPVEGTAADSVIYDRRRNYIFHYNKGNLVYMDNDLKADYIIVNAGTKEIFGTGVADSAGVVSRPEFMQGGAAYTMDSVTYNLDSGKALVQGVATQDGEGFLLGRRMKKMPDNAINIAHAKYTTCDNVEHPHFYIAMTKAKVIPGKKIITGPAYFVMEDVPVYLLGLPGGFFPISTGPTAGLVMPNYGEETNRGFYLRDGGYYFTFGDHVDLRLTADLYTLGSWALKAQSNYVQRYKYRGAFSATYNKLITGERNSTNYRNSNQFNVTWNHSQDPKANPWRTFSANVNFSTSGQKQMATTSLADHLNTNTSSSISYSRRWEVGSTSVNMSANFGLNTNSADSVLSVTLPQISLSVSSFAPFKRRAASGKQRWYEKITMSYSMNAQNQTGQVKEHEFFTKKTIENLQNGVSHSIPVKTSFNLFNYINFSPSFSYNEVWNFKRQYRVWDPDMNNGNGGMVPTKDLPTEFGFFRTYGWDLSGAFSTKIYGQFNVRQRPGKARWLQALRHVMTPTLGFTYAPDFRHPRYGFVEYVQSNSSGGVTPYSPNMGTPGPLGAGLPRASVTFSLSNQLEFKVRDRSDSTKKKNIKVIEQLAFNNISYNFMVDSMNLSPVSVTLRTGEIFKGFSVQLSGQWNPYQYVKVGNSVRQIGKLNIGRGKFGRITSTSWSFGHTFSSPNAPSPGSRSVNGAFVNPYHAENPYDLTNSLDPTTRRQYMVADYYDFRVPWSFTFNYNVNYNYTGLRPRIDQTLGFNGSVTLTEKMGINFNSGYDFTMRKLSHMQLNFTRDLHCWEMSFMWVPMGRIKQYSFHIGIKSGMLRDIKYDKSSNVYDNLMR